MSTDALQVLSTVNLADQNAEQIPTPAEDGSVTVVMMAIYLLIVTRNWQSGAV